MSAGDQKKDTALPGPQEARQELKLDLSGDGIATGFGSHEALQCSQR